MVFAGLVFISSIGYSQQVKLKTVVVLNGVEGKAYDGFRNLVFSPDNKKFSYIARSGNNWFLVVNGKEVKQYSIPKNILSPVFSANRMRTAYSIRSGSVQSGKKYGKAIDGVRGKMYDDVGVLPSFSPDSKTYIYRARLKNKWFLVVNGKEQKAYDKIRSEQFSPDSDKIVYIAKQGSKSYMVINGKEGKKYDQISDHFSFSPDSKKLAYYARTGNTWRVVINTKEQKAYDKFVYLDLAGDPVAGPNIAPIIAPVFSSDSKRLAYIAQLGKHSIIVLDGKESSRYSDVSRPVFSPDSKKVAYLGLNQGWSLFINGVRQKYAFTGNASLLFSADGTQIAYRKNLGGIIVNGKLTSVSKITSYPVYSPVGHDMAYGAEFIEGSVMVYKGKYGKTYHKVKTPIISHDGKQIAYIAEIKNKKSNNPK